MVPSERSCHKEHTCQIWKPYSDGKKSYKQTKSVTEEIFPICQRWRSRSRAKNLWYHRKGVVIRNTHAKYEKYEKVIRKIWKNYKQTKVWQRKFSQCRSKVMVKVTCYFTIGKGVFMRNTHAKYKSPTSEGKKVISKPKVWQTDRQTDGQTDRRRTKWSLSGAPLCWRHKKRLLLRCIHHMKLDLITGNNMDHFGYWTLIESKGSMVPARVSSQFLEIGKTLLPSPDITETMLKRRKTPINPISTFFGGLPNRQ